MEQLDQYHGDRTSGLLYLHTDKTLYTNNEQIWFSAYLINSSSTDNLQDHQLVAVALVANDTRRIALMRKYKMENGLGFGNLLLPDTIVPGDYHLVATTNRLRPDGRPQAVYIQPITVKSIVEQSFSSKLTVDSLIRDEAIEVKLTVALDDPDTQERPVVEYRVGNGEPVQHILEGREFSFHIPVEQIRQHQPALHASVRYGGQVQHLVANLPRFTPKQLQVDFFPEGGHLVNGLTSTVGWEAIADGGAPAAVTAFLYENNRVIDTVETNDAGVGRFTLNPRADAVYRVTVKAGVYIQHDTSFSLPPVAKEGIVLRLNEAIVNDTLRVLLSSNATRPVKVLVHNFREAFASFETAATPSGKAVSIALDALPKGIATLTVLDSLGNPAAERLFFAHHNRQINADIQLDSPRYHKRQPAQVSIGLRNEDGQPVQGILSAAVVQANRIENHNFENIVNYMYLERELGNLPPDYSGDKMDNKDYLEQLLLIRGWRNYTWQGLVEASPTDTAGIAAPALTGQVKRGGKPLRRPLEVILLSGTVPRIITTESDGSFALPMEELTVAADEEINLTVNVKDKRGYTIDITDPYWNIIENATDEIDARSTTTVNNVLSSEALELDGVEGMRILETVTVTARNDNSLYGTKGLPGPNECGDYVDEFGYLNYPPSAVSGKLYQPVKGKMYKIRTDLTADRYKFVVKNVIYEGCLTEKDKTHFQVDGVYYTKEFYGVSATSPEPQYQSTLLWQPGMVTNQDGKYSFDFTTGDIGSEFRIIIQGVSNEGVFFGSKKVIVE